MWAEPATVMGLTATVTLLAVLAAWGWLRAFLTRRAHARLVADFRARVAQAQAEAAKAREATNAAAAGVDASVASDVAADPVDVANVLILGKG